MTNIFVPLWLTGLRGNCPAIDLKSPFAHMKLHLSPSAGLKDAWSTVSDMLLSRGDRGRSIQISSLFFPHFFPISHVIGQTKLAQKFHIMKLTLTLASVHI